MQVPRVSTAAAMVMLLVLTGMVGHVISAQAGDPSMTNVLGTWKLNVAKSTYNPGPSPKSTIRKMEPWEGSFKTTIDTVDAQGQASHNETVWKFDGKDYPVKGAPAANTTRAYKLVDDRTYEVIAKVDGKVTGLTTRVVVARDGKTQTQTQTGKDAQGRTVNNVAVFEKQ